MRKCVSIAAIATAFVSYPAVAQTINPIDYCRENAADKDAQIACLEAAVTGLMSRGGAPDTEAMAAAAAAPKQSGQAPHEEAPSVAVAEAPETTEPEKPTGLGAEQVMARQTSEDEDDDDKDAITVAIADFAKTNTGRLVIVLQNGQVWRQVEGDTQDLNLSRGRKLTAEVWNSSLGGYKLRITEAKRTIRVRRLQ